MAKCKYRILAAQMANILEGIDRSIEQSKKALQVVQFYFYEKILLIGVPLTSKASFDQQFKAHAIGMSILSPSQELRMACRSCSLFGFYLPLRFRLRSQYLEVNPEHAFVTWWKVETTLAQDMESIAEKGYWEALLYCPDSTEFSYEIDWFEKENYTDSLTYQMRLAFATVGRENVGKAIIRKNLVQLAFPHFKTVVKKWENDDQGHDTIPKDPAVVFSKSFAPMERDDLDQAYAKVRRALRERFLRNYEHLMILWRDFLENLIFANVDWTEDEKEAFIKEWEINLFGCPLKRPIVRDGRWEQTMVIDRESAGKIIKHFIDRFLTDPSKKKRDGEMACLLWTLIWLAQDPDATGITLTRILDFDTTNVNKEYPAIIFDGKSIDISMGLHQLLRILQGKGKGKRLRRLFTHLSDDYLQHIVKEASLALFGSATMPILPAAFLSFPHPMGGARLSKKQRARLHAVDPGPEASYARRQILKMLRESLAKKLPSSS